MLILFTSKGALHLFFNRWHHPVFDSFFAVTTHLGDGLVFVPALLVSLFWKYRYALAVAIAGLCSGLLTSLFKGYLFAGAPRPAEFFGQDAALRLVPGIDVHHWNSFPSGHTLAAVALYCTLALLINRSWAYAAALFLSLVVAVSRMYLSQHFFVDTYFGALLGLGVALFAANWSARWKHPRWDRALFR